MPPAEPEVIEILDDDGTASEAEDNSPSASKSAQKRKHEAEIEENF